MLPAEGGNPDGVPAIIVDEVLAAGAGGSHFIIEGFSQAVRLGCVLGVEDPYYSFIVKSKGQTRTRRSTSS